MLKVFLVEDEFIVREGIKNIIDWSAHGYEFCGEASDGELALPMIQKMKPDIVITDIKMPFMDGLELSKLIKKELPWTEIIILTGYAEFEYAKEAIKIGIAEYLSKPIKSEELLKAVDNIAAKIEEKRKEREIREKYQKEMAENFLKDRKELFQYLVTGTKSVAELLEMADDLQMDLSAMWYNIVLVKSQSIKHAHDEYSNRLVRLEESMKKLDDESHILVFDRNLEGKAFLFKADTKEELERIQGEYLRRMQAILDENEYIRYFGGVGEPVNRLKELSFSFEKASHAFAHRYLMKESRILNSSEIETGVYLENEEFHIHDVNPKQINRTKISEFLKLGEAAEAIYFVEEFFKGLGSNAMNSSMFRQYIVMDAYFCVAEFLEELQIPKDAMTEYEVNPEDTQNKEAATAYVARLIQWAVGLREKTASNRYGHVVDEVMRYIEENFADEELSLNSLASHVNFSPSHLSMIFSQQTGQTIIKCLTDYRLNKAKELLRCTNKKNNVIALEVGYKDPHYFSYLFKKTQGMTPTQYRGGKVPDEDES